MFFTAFVSASIHFIFTASASASIKNSRFRCFRFQLPLPLPHHWQPGTQSVCLQPLRALRWTDGRTDGRTDRPNDKPTELSAISGWMTTSLNLFRGDANLSFKPTVHQKSLISFRDKNHRGKNQAKRDSTRPLSLSLFLSLSSYSQRDKIYLSNFQAVFFSVWFFFSNLFQFDLFLLFFFIF